MRQSNALRALSAATALVAGCGRAPATDGASGAPPAPAAPAAAAPAEPAPRNAARRPAGGPRTQASAPAPRLPEVAPAGPFTSCYDGFHPGDDPRVDVVRLGMACGPATGLTQFARRSGAVDDGGGAFTLRWPAERGDCYRLFGVAAAPVEDLEVEISESEGERLSLTNQDRRWVVVSEEAPFCARQDGELVARFTTHAGRGAVSASVWRGERMAPRRRAAAPAPAP